MYADDDEAIFAVAGPYAEVLANVGKPLGGKAYGSIPHLPGSKLGPAEHTISPGQARICIEAPRDKYDRIWVQEKLDGSCVAAWRDGDKIVPLTRAGYNALTSPYPQHWLWAVYCSEFSERFLKVLRPGERLCGEWLIQVHGHRYHGAPPFVAFDLIGGGMRLPFERLLDRVGTAFRLPFAFPGPQTIEQAMGKVGYGGERLIDSPAEGAVWRAERNGSVDFLAKYVCPDAPTGKYLSGPPVWQEGALRWLV